MNAGVPTRIGSCNMVLTSTLLMPQLRYFADTKHLHWHVHQTFLIRCKSKEKLQRWDKTLSWGHQFSLRRRGGTIEWRTPSTSKYPTSSHTCKSFFIVARLLGPLLSLLPYLRHPSSIPLTSPNERDIPTTSTQRGWRNHSQPKCLESKELSYGFRQSFKKIVC